MAKSKVFKLCPLHHIFVLKPGQTEEKMEMSAVGQASDLVKEGH